MIAMTTYKIDKAVEQIDVMKMKIEVTFRRPGIWLACVETIEDAGALVV